MKTKILVSLVTIIFFAACNKDDFNTKPTLKFKSVSTKVVPVGGTLRVEMEFTDKEGDISDTLFFRKIRTNKKVVATLRDSLKITVPDVPTTRKGLISIDLEYENYLKSAINPGTNPVANDTLTLKFALRDKAKNVSDTVTIDNIVVLR